MFFTCCIICVAVTFQTTESIKALQRNIFWRFVIVYINVYQEMIRRRSGLTYQFEQRMRLCRTVSSVPVQRKAGGSEYSSEAHCQRKPV